VGDSADVTGMNISTPLKWKRFVQLVRLTAWLAVAGIVLSRQAWGGQGTGPIAARNDFGQQGGAGGQGRGGPRSGTTGEHER